MPIDGIKTQVVPPLAVFKSLPFQMALLDGEGKIVSVNDAWQQFAVDNGGSADPEFCVGLNYIDVCKRSTGANVESSHAAGQGIKAVLDGAETYFDLEYPCHSATVRRWFLLTVTPLQDMAGAIVIHVDITERKLAELEIHQRSLQQSAVAEIGQLAVAGTALTELMDIAVAHIADILGVEYCKILELLPSNEPRLLLRAGVGWQPGLVGQATVGTERDSQAGYTLLSSAPVIVDDLTTDPRFSGPALLQEHAVISGVSVIIGEKSAPYGVLGAHTTQRRTFSEDDVSFVQAVANILAETVVRHQHRGQLEQRVADRTAELAASKAEADMANRTKTVFLAAASHDLRQPLQTLNLLNGALQKKTTDPALLDLLQRERKAMTAMGDLLNGLLDLGRLESGNISPQFEDFPLRKILQRMQERFEIQAQDKKLQFIVEPSDHIVHSDQTLLERIIENLVGNAIRYTHDGMVALRCRSQPGHVRIEVVDSGIGIPEAQLAAVFQEFHQVDAADRRSGGLGLGLAIVDQMAKLLGLRVQVESQPGTGSVFAVTVPAGEAAEVISELPATYTPRLDGTIAFIDDDKSVADAVCLLLEVEGFAVRMFSNVTDTLAWFTDASEVPDLLLSDYHLGRDGTGFDAINRVRDLLGPLPAVVMTGDTTLGKAPEECTILHKPTSPALLLQTIRQCIVQRRSNLRLVDA